jgi:hypothetical protein
MNYAERTVDMTSFRFCCAAAGCKIPVRYDGKFCGPHFRKIPKAIKDQLSERQPGARLAAIKAVAAKEGKSKLYRELEMAQDR